MQDTEVIEGVAEAPPVDRRAYPSAGGARAEVVLKDGMVASLLSYIGVDSSSDLQHGRLLINLKPHSERDVSPAR